MAEAWVKMRQALAKDPRVIRMATTLRQSSDFQKWAVGQTCDIGVTQNVTVCVTVASLLQVWSVARSQGKADGDDLVLKHSSLDTLDELAGVPGFGKVMESVEWAQVENESSLRFPKCLAHMLSPEEREREKAAERKRIQRDKERDLSRLASRSCPTNVTPREENKTIHKDPGAGTGFSEVHWWKGFEASDLKDDSKLDVLFGAVCAAKYAHDTPEDRQRFAAFVIYLRRQDADKPFGLFTRIIDGGAKGKYSKSKDWRGRATDADHDAARRLLRKIDAEDAA